MTKGLLPLCIWLLLNSDKPTFQRTQKSTLTSLILCHPESNLQSRCSYLCPNAWCVESTWWSGVRVSRISVGEKEKKDKRWRTQLKYTACENVWNESKHGNEKQKYAWNFRDGLFSCSIVSMPSFSSNCWEEASNSTINKISISICLVSWSRETLHIRFHLCLWVRPPKSSFSRC